jgi:hypothetical protein
MFNTITSTLAKVTPLDQAYDSANLIQNQRILLTHVQTTDSNLCVDTYWCVLI